MKSLKFNKYIRLDTYVRDVQLFYPYINELVRDVFRFKADPMKRAETIFNRMDPNKHTMVSIHVRLTDMDGHLKNLWNLKNAQGEYYRRAMQYFHKRYKVRLI